LVLSCFSQSNPNTTAIGIGIGIDERHASLFEGAFDDLAGRTTGLTDARFELVDGHNPNPPLEQPNRVGSKPIDPGRPGTVRR
jgi:hypothetical protein